VYSRLIGGLLPESRAAIVEHLETHHEKFAAAAEKFLRDPAFVAAFRNLARRHTEEAARSASE
jgi:hypothetical protein